MLPNPYILGGIALAVTLALWKVYDAGYSAGADAVTAAYAASLAAEVKEEQEDVKEIIKWKEKKVIVYRDRVTEIHTAADQTGCLDTPLTGIGLGGMLRTDSDTSIPAADNAP